MQTMQDIRFENQLQVQDQFLATLLKSKIPTYIYLKNGIKLQGFIEAYDEFSVILKNQESQLIFKTSIATIMPAFGIKDLKKQSPKSRAISVE